jgi:hypothetical protein
MISKMSSKSARLLSDLSQALVLGIILIVLSMAVSAVGLYLGRGLKED